MKKSIINFQGKAVFVVSKPVKNTCIFFENFMIHFLGDTGSADCTGCGILFSCVNFFIFSDWRVSSSARDVMIYAHEHESDRSGDG